MKIPLTRGKNSKNFRHEENSYESGRKKIETYYTKKVHSIKKKPSNET